MRSVKQDRAISHITEQMMKDAKDGIPKPEFQAIEEMLTEICTTDAVAERLLADGKSLNGAYKALEDTARKERLTCIPPSQAMQIIEGYYCITDEDKAASRPTRRKHSAPIDVLSQI